MSYESDYTDAEGSSTRMQADDGEGRSKYPSERCADSPVANWHPDYSLSSPEARKWHKQNQHSSHEALNLDEAGTYTVQRGDCLSSIAARELRAEGKTATKKAIAHEVEQIVALNKHKYKDLDCNKEYLKAGWKLRLLDCNSSSQGEYDSPQQSHRQVQHSRRHHTARPIADTSYGDTDIRPQPEYAPLPRYRSDDSNAYSYQRNQPNGPDSAGLGMVAGSLLPLILGATRQFQQPHYYQQQPQLYGVYGGYGGYGGYDRSYTPYGMQNYGMANYGRPHHWHHDERREHWGAPQRYKF